MADDTPTVDALRERLYDYLRTSQDKCEGKVDPDLRRDVDALIAAVRAEERRAVDENGQYKESTLTGDSRDG